MGQNHMFIHESPAVRRCLALIAVAIFAGTSGAKEKEKLGQTFSTEVVATQEELVEAVQDVVGDGIIQGTKEYEKDTYVGNANEVESTPVFPKWTEPGQVFYKVRTDAIAPRNFYASAASGTLAVRYVIQPKDETRCILRIDAIYVESEHRNIHPSNGTVETTEYRDIQDHVDAIQLRKKQAAEAERNREEEVARRSLEQASSQYSSAASGTTATAANAPQTIEQHVQDLRQRLERVVKAPGAQLKAAPYHEAAKLKELPAGTELVILVVSPYWYGVETAEGQHGWIHHGEVEALR